VLVLIVGALVREPRQGALVVGGVLAVAGVFGVLAVTEWADVFALQHPVLFTPGYGIRARVTFLDPNILASFLMSSILLAVPLVASAPMKRALRVAGVVALLAALVGLATTYSRGGLGGLVIGLVAIAAVMRAPRRARLIFVAVMVLAILAAGVLVFDARWVQENVLGAGETGSATNRVYMVEGALRMWLDHPFGVGLDNYQVVYPAYRDPRAEAGIVESHTAYVTVLAEMGFLGLLAFLWVLGAFFARTALPAARTARDTTLHALATGAFAASLALAAQAFTYSLEASKFWWFAIGLGIAAWCMASREPAAEAAPAPVPDAEGESSLT
jgi:O-antigen ligase